MDFPGYKVVEKSGKSPQFAVQLAAVCRLMGDTCHAFRADLPRKAPFFQLLPLYCSFLARCKENFVLLQRQTLFYFNIMAKFDKEELRQRAAIAAMQSLVAKCKDDETSFKQLAMREVFVDGEKRIQPLYNRDWIAEEAVAYADAMVNVLCVEEEA